MWILWGYLLTKLCVLHKFVFFVTLLTVLKAVSYTHLDVYKRQEQDGTPHTIGVKNWRQLPLDFIDCLYPRHEIASFLTFYYRRLEGEKQFYYAMLKNIPIYYSIFFPVFTTDILSVYWKGGVWIKSSITHTSNASGVIEFTHQTSEYKRVNQRKRNQSRQIRRLWLWCEWRDLNPYVMDTRPSNVPVCRFQHTRRFKLLCYYTIPCLFCQQKITKSLAGQAARWRAGGTAVPSACPFGKRGS